MRTKYLPFALLLLLFASFVESQEPTSHPIHNFFFFEGPGDFNRNVFYRNKLEFSFHSGWEPINIPFPYDFVTAAARRELATSIRDALRRWRDALNPAAAAMRQRPSTSFKP